MMKLLPCYPLYSFVLRPLDCSCLRFTPNHCFASLRSLVFINITTKESSLLLVHGIYKFHLEPGLNLNRGFASFVRSNAIIYAGVFIFEILERFIKRKRFSFKFIATTPILILTVMSGFIAFQSYAFMKFCTSESTRPWCHNKVPIMYTFVQKEYWYSCF